MEDLVFFQKSPLFDLDLNLGASHTDSGVRVYGHASHVRQLLGHCTGGVWGSNAVNCSAFNEGHRRWPDRARQRR